MGLTKNGFNRKTYEELLTDMSNSAKEKFGQDANVTERSVLGILIRVMSWFLSLLWQEVEHTYHSNYRKTAEGHQLDMLVPYAGISRRLAEYSYGYVQFTGVTGTVIPSGFAVGTDKDIEFFTIEDCEIDHNNQALAKITSSLPGKINNTPANTIVNIMNPTMNVESVNNPSPTEGGKDAEADTELRRRADLTAEGVISGTTAAIRSELLRTENVRSAKVIENFTDYVDQYGTPPRSIQAIVLGGTNEDIAHSVHRKKAAGIQPYGSTYVQIKDESGFNKTIGFTRAEEIILSIKVEVKIDQFFPVDGVKKVKTAVIQYIGGIDEDLYMYGGLNMGEKVIHARLTSKVFAVEGVLDVDIFISTNGGAKYTQENITVAMQQVAQVNANNIEVTTSVQF